MPSSSPWLVTHTNDKHLLRACLVLDTILGNEAIAMDAFTELTAHCAEANDQ